MVRRPARHRRPAAPAAVSRSPHPASEPTRHGARQLRAQRSGPTPPTPTAAELFELLFPNGVQMTAERLAEFEQWAELTGRLTGHARTSHAS